MTDGQHTRPHGGYRAYLVRLWHEGPESPWRALTRDAETGEEHRFATIEQLFLFLHRQTLPPENVREDGSASHSDRELAPLPVTPTPAAEQGATSHDKDER